MLRLGGLPLSTVNTSRLRDLSNEYHVQSCGLRCSPVPVSTHLVRLRLWGRRSRGEELGARGGQRHYEGDGDSDDRTGKELDGTAKKGQGVRRGKAAVP